MDRIFTKLKNFDAYPKTLDDFRVRTFSGAAVSIISGLFIVWLFFSELSFYLSTEVHPELFVDTSRGEKLRINIDVTFPDLPCSYLSLDAMDVSGEHQLDVDHGIFKKRLGRDGKPLGIIRSELESTTEVDENAVRLPDDYCGSCYGSETEPNQCCNTCEEVREAYRRKGWAFANADSIEQCTREGFTKKLEEAKGEGCQVYGYLLVNKVAGNFHFAPGKSFQSHHNHVHDLQPFNMDIFNISHIVHRISFGKDFPGIINPLDGVQKIVEKDSGMFKYFVKIVPTIYESLDGDVIKTNQFSVTEHFKPIQQVKEGGLPGVFVMYDLSPIMVKFTERQKSFAHFLTGVCAIIGGVFTVAGIIDSLIYNSMRSLGKKIELGKAS
eukprot:CAMPEP_0174261658 /NCGR_PEP_ID=MMETSP0439-20130205/11738_1 /TAXON_ID=0 /ORGANISM="Stereomyxa ramosa, Strain Chinc5" /LENGTH=381 /DNA_ID=CAMNT_0015346171 /DNA_START=61 /DNA_END=1206 /DNA_ORIENTATION=-